MASGAIKVCELGRRATAEAVGTFFLVLIGPGAAMVNAITGGALGVVGIALAFAFVIIAMVYALGHLSGAHLNPAVTVAFWSTGRFPRRDVVPYVVAQCTGAIAASALSRAALGPVGHLGATLPALAPPISLAAAFALEFAMSFALMFVIMAVATDDRVAPGFAPIAVGLTVGFCALMGGPLTGASMNPARSLGPALIGGEWRAHWVYWLAPITAMLVAARAYDALRMAAAPRTDVETPVIGVEGAVEPPLDAAEDRLVAGLLLIEWVERRAAAAVAAAANLEIVGTLTCRSPPCDTGSHGAPQNPRRTQTSDQRGDWC